MDFTGLGMGIKSPVVTSSLGWDTDTCLHLAGVRGCLWARGGKGKALELYFEGWFICCITQDGISLQHSELRAPPELSVLNSCSPSQVSPRSLLQLLWGVCCCP